VVLPRGARQIEAIDSLRWENWISPFGPGAIHSQELISGEIIVIRGGSGLGKTTFLNSLLGLNQSSTASINQIPTSDIERKSLFQQIGWIPQNPVLISGSIREMFLLVKPKITSQELESLLARVGLDIAQLPDGVETVIGGLGEKSAHLSGGQRRRIAIARALAIDPTLIIADEPTADLDPQSAAEVLKILHGCAQSGAIVIAVLHAPDQGIEGAREIVMVDR
jgi:ABC-type transport system involved in cytochrome bd biosynthesis fused ATPase/permease subunit